ncbi:hypothetical protein UA08_01238 [Talaromyces atroroseus]|uniref:Uncharacterized protein n=1 Tax=Talaromyces atroroseus TaxID=1441469 RepID=A0A1Q5QAP6_TALAT|nr:hypothetical protein UA08_01238 [Talaromyces atroroseus]OKL63012.1 hypothetical protein UA08_01238 [Talaromyces atroroseus]
MDTGFKIGIEFEVLLTPRGRHKKDFAELEGFAQFIVDRCNDVPNPAPRAHNDVDGVYEGPNQTSEWSITDDATIKPDRDDQSLINLLGPSQQVPDSVEIADLMNEDGKRYYSWNFTNLYHGGKATVEFRQAPCAVNETSCLPWVELVVTFVHASKVTSSFQDLRRYSRDIQGMRRFITSHQPSGYKRAVLAQLFTGKYGYVVPKPLGTPTAEEQVNRDAKQAKESGFMKKLEYFQSE